MKVEIYHNVKKGEEVIKTSLKQVVARFNKVSNDLFTKGVTFSKSDIKAIERYEGKTFSLKAAVETSLGNKIDVFQDMYDKLETVLKEDHWFLKAISTLIEELVTLRENIVVDIVDSK